MHSEIRCSRPTRRSSRRRRRTTSSSALPRSLTPSSSRRRWWLSPLQIKKPYMRRSMHRPQHQDVEAQRRANHAITEYWVSMNWLKRACEELCFHSFLCELFGSTHDSTVHNLSSSGRLRFIGVTRATASTWLAAELTLNWSSNGFLSTFQTCSGNLWNIQYSSVAKIGVDAIEMRPSQVHIENVISDLSPRLAELEATSF